MPRGYGHGVAVGDYRQRRPARPVRHPLRLLRPLPQPGRRDLRGPDRCRRPGRRPRVADLGRLRRPRRRRRSRPLRLPLRAMGSATTRPAVTTRRPSGRRTASRGRSRPSPIDSSATTAVGSSTSRRRPGSSTATGEAWASSRPTSTATAGSTSSWPTTRRPTTHSSTEGGLRFRESGLESGLAANAASSFLAGMGVACGDTDGDGRPDLAVTNFYDESTTLYRNLGHGSFADDERRRRASPSRVAICSASGSRSWTYNNDGHLDLATANGHVNDSRPLYPYAMPALLLAGSRVGTIRRRHRHGRSADDHPSRRPRPGGRRSRQRRQGRPRDRLSGGASRLPSQCDARAVTTSCSGLEGTRSARDAVGARVVVSSGGRRLSAWRFGGGSYLSAIRPAAPFRDGRPGSGRVRRGVLAVGPDGSLRGPEGRCRIPLAGRPADASSAARFLSPRTATRSPIEPIARHEQSIIVSDNVGYVILCSTVMIRRVGAVCRPRARLRSSGRRGRVDFPRTRARRAPSTPTTRPTLRRPHPSPPAPIDVDAGGLPHIGPCRGPRAGR